MSEPIFAGVFPVAAAPFTAEGDVEPGMLAGLMASRDNLRCPA